MAITLNGTTGITTPAIDNQGNLSVDGGTIKLDGNYPVGTGNVALGNQALDDGSLSGNFNTAMGNNALTANTSGAQNTVYGAAAMQTNTTGANNTAIGGNGPLQANTSGGNNTAVGYAALFSNTTASNNTAVGYQAGYANTTGAANTAVGQQALKGNAVGELNTAVGVDSLLVATGSRNTVVGVSAGSQITTGAKNTIIGTYSGNQGGLDIRTSSNNIVLSDGDGVPRVVVNSIGKLGVNRTDPGAFISSTNAIGSYCYESVPVNQSGVYYHFDFKVGGTGVGTITSSVSSTSYNTSSDHRLKENVVYDWDATTRLKQLKPARFNFIVDADRTVDGFLAHEAQEVVPEAVRGTHNEVDADGAAVMQGIDQSKLVPLLVKTIQELEARITALEGN
jgi:trimeric autotransporter adhesin